MRAVAGSFPDGHHGARQGSAARRSAPSSPIWCWRSAAPARITLLAAALVLGGALAAGHRHRVYDAVILKTLGATRARLIGAYTIEYLLLGARHRVVRRAERLAGRLADRDRTHAFALCLAAAAGAGRGAGGALP